MVHRLLVAPGGRFRLESHWGGGPASVRVSAGSEPGSGSESGSARQEPGPTDPPCADLLCPAWLPARYQLELAGLAVVAGRHAHRVIATQRPVQQGRSRPRQSVPRPAHRGHQWPRDVTGRIDAAVDVELGILLRYELTYGGQVVRRHEVTSIAIDPPQGADDQQFAAVPDDEDTSDATLFSGPGWERAKTAASASAAALSFAIRHSPQRESPAGARPDPQASPEPGESEWPGEPVGQDVLSLLYEAGLRRSEFDAELRTWTDATAAATAFAGATRNTTMSGVRRLSDALSDRATAWQVREAIKVGLPSRYRIDYIDGGIKRRTCTTDAADGTQRWRVYADHVTVGPLAGLPAAIARLVDPSWLLDWQLTGGAPVSVGGQAGPGDPHRRALRHTRPGRDRSAGERLRAAQGSRGGRHRRRARNPAPANPGAGRPAVAPADALGRDGTRAKGCERVRGRCPARHPGRPRQRRSDGRDRGAGAGPDGGAPSGPGRHRRGQARYLHRLAADPQERRAEVTAPLRRCRSPGWSARRCRLPRPIHDLPPRAARSRRACR